ncbi:MAG TPA: acyl-homoserine-lactone synthase [Ktedonobacterales bacterium]|nr:acyl-homoserine-lactone synthase [Ktedonobacterales bacterium]
MPIRSVESAAPNTRGSAHSAPAHLFHPRYTFRVLSPADTRLLASAQRLRADVFARELAWVPECACGREHDRCDAAATHLVVLAADGVRQSRITSPHIVGYARLLLPRDNFMLAREFAALLDGGPLRLESTRAFEVSRFVVHPALRGRRDADGRGAAEHLQRGIARWALERGRADLYSVCEARHVRALRMRGLPVRRFGRMVEYTPGVLACAVHLDLRAAADTLRDRRPWEYRWYTQGDFVW